MGTNLKGEKGIEGNTETATKFQAKYGRRADPIRQTFTKITSVSCQINSSSERQQVQALKNPGCTQFLF
jgi:hypothetical protein